MYQDRAEVIKLTNKWVTIDPREWHNQFDFVINVGLGSGNRDQVAGQLMQILELQTQGMQLGLADPQKIYHTGAKLLENMGFKNPESFFIDPSQQQPEQQEQEQPDPELIKAQTEAQIKMQEMELKRWQAEQDIILKRERLIAEMNLKRQEMALKMGAAVEQDLYHQYDQQNTGFIADDGTNAGAGNATQQGIDEGQPSPVDTEQPFMVGDVPVHNGDVHPAMDEQYGQ